MIHMKFFRFCICHFSIFASPKLYFSVPVHAFRIQYVEEMKDKIEELSNENKQLDQIKSRIEKEKKDLKKDLQNQINEV